MVSRLSYINTDSALQEGSRFANRILSSGKTGRGSSVSTIRHEHFHWGSSGWGYFPQPVYYGGPSGSFPDEKKDYSWVAIPAAAIALFTMYFIGENHAEWSQAKSGMEKLQQTNKVVRSELANTHPALKSVVQSVFEKQMSILDRIRSDAATGLLLKVILVTSVIAAGLGGLATGGWLVPTLSPLLGYGSVSSFLTSCSMLYRAGFRSGDAAIQAEAEELQATVKQAARVLDQVAQGA